MECIWQTKWESTFKYMEWTIINYSVILKPNGFTKSMYYQLVVCQFILQQVEIIEVTKRINGKIFMWLHCSIHMVLTFSYEINHQC